jgi:hypothetical protein
MRPDDYPHPVSDPAAAGLPEYADDDSAADSDVPLRDADGPDPAPLAPDREDGPLALDEFGTTAEEQRRGEPLDRRLAREVPDVPLEDVPAPARRPDSAAAAADVPHEWTEPDPDATAVDDGAFAPEPDSPVSEYERMGTDPAAAGTVGRLVQPDEGAHEDTDAEEFAVDAGVAGGGAGAEEAAMHEVTDGGGLREGRPGDGYLRD